MNSKTARLTTAAMLCAVAYIAMALIRIPVVLFLKYAVSYTHLDVYKRQSCGRPGD